MNSELGSEALTHGIRIQVEPQFDPRRSDPDEGRWFFLYTVTVTNESEVTAQLISRHWIITDAEGKVEEVRGPGVIGEQPRLTPGESFSYTSGCPLRTEFGSMHGTYQMATDDGKEFDVEIAPFTLSEPYTVH